MKKNLKQLVVAAAFCVASVPAFAQWAVFDPTNFVQNYAQAISGIKTEITTAKTLIQETQTAINMAKSIKGMADMDGLAQVKEALRLYKQLDAVDGKLENDFQQSADLAERVLANYGASKMSWPEFLQSSNAIHKKQRETSAERYRAINASIQQTAQQRQAIVSKLGNVEGQTEAMQAVGAAVDVLIGQNQQMISILATNSKIAETKALNETAMEAKREEEGVKIMNNYQRRLRESANKY